MTDLQKQSTTAIQTSGQRKLFNYYIKENEAKSGQQRMFFYRVNRLKFKY